jgi:hypothetical protein
MPVRITCPFCCRDLRLPEELYEGPVQCPLCDGAFALRWYPRGAGPEPSPVRPAVTIPERARRCPFCGEPLERQAAKCPACGEVLAT